MSESVAPARSRRRRRAHRAPGPRIGVVLGFVASVVAVSLVAVTGVGAAEAAVVRGFGPVFSANTNGDILLTANTLMTCAPAGTGSSTCAANQAGSGTATNNNDHTMQFVDVDGDASTFNSSSASLTIPVGGTVLFAALVWSGRTDSATPAGNPALTSANPNLRGTMRFTVPGSAAQDVTASRVDLSASSPTATNVAFQSYLDVTGIVAKAGSGTYTAANVQSLSGGTDQYAGWALVVAVADPAAPARNLTIFNGFAVVSSGDPALTFPISGFVTPPSGPVQTTLGAVTYEGDLGFSGDSMKLNGTPIGDAANPPDNPFNSTISNRGTAVSTSNPSNDNQLGFDADLFTADGVLANGATGATISLTTSQDTYYPGIVTFATDLYDPKLLGTKTVSDDNGGSVVPGDTLTYTVPVQNIGLDTSATSTFFDAVPTGTTYLPGSLTVDGVPQTDAADTVDNGQYVATDNGHLVAYLGTGATPTSGGDIPVSTVSAQHTVTFKVTVNPGTSNGQQLVNSASLMYRGKTTGAASASTTNAVVSPVTTTPVAGNGQPTAAPAIVSFTPTPTQRSLTIPVLNGSSDPDGDALSVVAVTDAAGGSVTINPDGTVTYAPRDDFAGRDAFTYTIDDGHGNKATAAVQVEVANGVPVAGDDTITAPGSTPTTVHVLANDTDPNGDVLSVRSADASSAQGGTVTVVGNDVVYTGAAGFRGTDTFTYVVQDSRGGSDTGAVTVTVANNAPIARDDTVGLAAGSTAPLTVLANDSDPDGDTLTATQVTGPSHGTLVLRADGTGTYTPAAGWSGTDTFTYQVSDGHGGTSAVATVTLSVDGAPVAVADASSAAADTAVDVAVLSNDSDPDGDPLVVQSVTAPAHGSAVVLANGAVRYTPSSGWAGPDSVDYTISDGRGLTGTATVSLSVANAAPVANPDSAATPADTPAAGINVVANDTDANVTAGVPGQALAVSGTPTADHATVTVAPDGTLTVTPTAGYAGAVTVTYTLTDGAGGTATGTLTLTVADAAPVAAPDGPITTPTNTSVLIDVTANDTDANGDTLTIDPGSLSVPLDTTGTVRGSVLMEAGKVRYTPPTGFTGQVTFPYTVSDGRGGTATSSVIVRVANAAPVAVDDAATTATNTPISIDVTGNDTDPNIPGGSQQLIVVAATADHGARVVLDADGRVTLTPPTGFTGTLTGGYTVSDGAGGTAHGVLTVTVTNAPPAAVDDSARTAYATAVQIPVLVNDTDANGDVLAIVAGSVTGPLDAAGLAAGAVSVTNGDVVYTPRAGYSGTVTFRYAVSDGTARSVATVTVTVENAPPVVRSRARAATTTGPVVVDVLADATDPDGGALTLVAVDTPAHGTVAIVDGRLVYTPQPGWAGDVQLSYQVADPEGATATGTATVHVSAAVSASRELARTGTDVMGALVAGGLAVLTGLGLMLLADRRRRTA